MTALVVDNIGQLVTCDPTLGAGPLGVRRQAALVLEGGVVRDVVAAGTALADERIDVEGRCVLPGFVDSHTHLVFAGDRAEEFAARMAGQPYAAGGIRVTTAATRATRDDELLALGRHRLDEARRNGTTTVEIKSGYGLTTAEEARCLHVARQLADDTTFLGAHVVPAEFEGDAAAYVAEILESMLPACAPLARFADAFCEEGAFDEDQCRTILRAAQTHGLVPKVHANQLRAGPGVRLAVELGAASADHCTYLTDGDIDALAAAAGTTVATLLPASDFSTRQPYPPGRRLVDAGAIVALATNCNPGSSYTTSMPFVIALAVRELHLTVAEAVLAATVGGAAALRRTDVGRLTPGCRADATVLDAPGPEHLAYRPGVPLVAGVVQAGEMTYRDPLLWPG